MNLSKVFLLNIQNKVLKFGRCWEIFRMHTNIPFSSSDDKEIWICYPCKNSSFSPKNSTVEIEVGGLYYFHAQVTFQLVNNPATVTLRKNKSPGTQDRTLSRVKHYGQGTATMIRLVELTKGDSISLEIDPIHSISRQAYETYWEIIFLNNK